MDVLSRVMDRPIGLKDRATEVIYTIFWVFVKAHDESASINALKNNIEAFICEVPAEMLEKEYQNGSKRIGLLRYHRGQI